MTRLLERIDNKKFFFSYFFVICIYLIFQRLSGFPQSVAYLMYAIGIFLSLKELCGSLKGMSGKPDVFFLFIFWLYYFISSLIYAGLNTTSMSWLFTDWLYSLLPISYYVIYRISNRRLNKVNIIRFTLLAIIILDTLSLITFVAPSSSLSGLFDQEKLTGEGVALFALHGIVGVIGTGFINVIGLCICLLSPINLKLCYRIIFSSLFVICAFLSGQRTPIGGILIVFFFFVLKHRMRAILGLIFLCVIIAFGASKINIEVGGHSIIESVVERNLNRFESLKSGVSGRENQQIISEDGGAMSFIIGEGVGKYSPENPEAIIAMSDAMLYRIYNEMGVLGLFFFLIFFIINLCHALKTNNSFMLALIIYVFFANYFNRVLFIAPISIIPYFLIASFNWDDISGGNVSFR